jgi:PAS domain S-box-containing protein
MTCCIGIEEEMRGPLQPRVGAEEQFRLLVESVTDYALYMLGPDGRVVTWNAGAERSKGYKAEEVLGRCFSMFFLPADAEAGVPEQELAEAARIGRFETEAWRLRKDGSIFWALVTLTAIRGPDRELLGFAKVTRDMTERKKAADALRSVNAQLERYRIMVESVDEYFIYTLDPEGRIAAWEAGAQKLSDTAPEKVLGRHFSIFFSSADAADGLPDRLLAEAARTGRSTSDAWMFTPNGKRVWSSGVLNAVRDEAGRLTGFVRVARDMTQQKLLEDSLARMAADLEDQVRERTRQLEATVGELRLKNEEVEAFVYIVSHDLRAPLVNVQGFARELEYSCARLKSVLAGCAGCERVWGTIRDILDDEIAGALRYISASSTKFERLIDALLGLSRQGRQVYRIVPVDAGEVVATTVASLRQLIVEAGAAVRVGLLPRAFADQTALGQVFSNLIGNCLKYRSPLRRLAVEVGGEIAEGSAHFWVKDNGLGIPESGKSRLFQVFQRLHPKQAEGEGMGLAIAHRIVERHAGRIWAESQEGQGATFHFSLPAAPGALPTASRKVVNE